MTVCSVHARGIGAVSGCRCWSVALWILEQWVREGRGQPLVVYLGDDDADEEAYVVL